MIVVETWSVDEGHGNAVGHQEFVFFNLRDLQLLAVFKTRNALADDGVDELSERQEWRQRWLWTCPYRRFPGSSLSHNPVAVVCQLNTQREMLH